MNYIMINTIKFNHFTRQTSTYFGVFGDFEFFGDFSLVSLSWLYSSNGLIEEHCGWRSQEFGEYGGGWGLWCHGFQFDDVGWEYGIGSATHSLEISFPQNLIAIDSSTLSLLEFIRWLCCI